MIDIRLYAVLDFVCVQGQLHRFCTDQGLWILSPPIAYTGIALGRDPLKARMNRRKDNGKQKLFPDYCFETDFNIFEPNL